MGLHNIWDNNGIGIALTGMTIVFAALTMISVFISLLPKVLDAFSLVLPPEPEPQLAAQPESSGDEEIAAVIGFALHQMQFISSQTKSSKD